MSDSATELSRLTGAQILVEYLVRQGVPFAAGIPGHGCWAITDALLDRQDAIRTIQVMHEQSAVHLADGYFRATGKPMLAFTSIGPGAMNTLVGMGTAYVDSTAVESTYAVPIPMTVFIAPGPMLVKASIGWPVARK